MKRKFIVKQNDIKDCGVCCLQSIIKFYNGYIPLEILRLDTKTNQNGTTAYNILKTAKKYGLNGYGKKMNSLEEDIQLPAIAHITTEKGINHFVVIYKITENNVILMDPSKGYIKVPKEKFLSEWSKVVLILQPYKTIPLYKTNNNIINLIINVVHCENTLISKLIITNILIIILSIILSYHFQITVSALRFQLYLFVAFLFLTILKIYINYIRNKITINLSTNIDLSIIPSFISHIIKLPLNVIKSRTSGEILTRVNDLNTIKNLFSEIIINVILDLSLILCSSIFLYFISNELFFILCVISLLYILIGLLSSPILNRKINDNIDLETEFNSNLTETISSLETIKNLNIIEKSNENIVSKYNNYVLNYFKLNKFYNMINILCQSINEIGVFCISSYGIYLYSIGKLSLLSLITYNSLLSYFIEPIKNLINYIPNLYQIKLSYIKSNEFLSVEQEKIGEIENFSNGNIRYNNISYSYNDYNKVLNKVNITFKKNNHYILKGTTGSGKSTLLRMLNHNINDYEGNITINNINIKDYSLNTLRKNILYVSQNETLFSDTIYNNMVLNNAVSKEELNKIMKITKVDELIEKKSLRLESMLYDNGFNLSGGEKQRIILARSLISKPNILILDESLSETDKKTEKYILDQIDKNYKDMTIIYITHTNNNSFKNVIKITNNL